MKWFKTKPYEYFDNRNINSIWVNSEEFSKLSVEQQNDLMPKVAKWCWDYAFQLDDITAKKFLITTVDDVYRAIAANDHVTIPDSVFDYVNMTINPIVAAMKQRGICIHYVSSNSFSNLVWPVLIFPYYFDSAGLKYICPQHYVKEHYLGDKKMDALDECCTIHIDEARNKCAEKIDECIAKKQSYVYLDLNSEETDLNSAFFANHI